MGKFLYTAAYLGVGAACHALVIGTTFQAANMWSWAWLCAWPVMLGVAWFFVVLAALIVVVLLVGAYAWISSWSFFANRRRAALRRSIIAARR